jgi:hypothetical protein
MQLVIPLRDDGIMAIGRRQANDRSHIKGLMLVTGKGQAATTAVPCRDGRRITEPHRQPVDHRRAAEGEGRE